jgi:hypothetical protein
MSEAKTNLMKAIQEKLGQAEHKRARCLDPDWVYTPAAATDIRRTWLKFGWQPINEQYLPAEEK